jgi:hypothetical protein
MVFGVESLQGEAVRTRSLAVLYAVVCSRFDIHKAILPFFRSTTSELHAEYPKYFCLSSRPACPRVTFRPMFKICMYNVHTNVFWIISQHFLQQESKKEWKLKYWSWLRSLQLTLAVVGARGTVHTLFVNSSLCIPVRNTSAWSTVVFCVLRNTFIFCSVLCDQSCT